MIPGVASLYQQIVQVAWNIAFIKEGLDDILKGCPLHFHFMSHSFTDRWFADPFILSVDNKHVVLLAEEYSLNEHKGWLYKIVQANEQKDLGERVRKKVEDQFSLKQMGLRYEQIFERVLNQVNHRK